MRAPLSTTFGSIFDYAARRADHLAIIADDRRVSYGELKSLVQRIAGGLAARDVCLGDRICIETHDPVDHFTAAVAVMLLGGVAVALPNDSAASYAAVLEDAKPKLVLVNGERRVGFDTPATGVTVGALLDAGAGAELPLRQPAPEEIAMIYYTSGTTSGVRKGVLQSYRALAATAQYITDVMRLDDRVIEYVASPMDNAFWFGRCRVLVHNGGTALVATGSLNPLKILSVLRREGGNCIAGDTPIFTLFLHHMSSRLTSIGPQILWAKVASQAMSLVDKRALQEHLPNARIIMNYGLTEAMRCCLLPFRDFPDKLDSVGRPSPGVTARIVSPDGTPQPVNELGEIQVRGPNVASGYLNKDELWQSRYKNGWYHTGDIGLIDEDGFVFIRGRRDEAINVGGRTIAPNEVEDHLRRLMPGRRLAVFSIPDPSNVLGDVIAVALEGGWDFDVPWKEFRIRLFEEMPPSFVPRDVFLVSQLAITSNGKIRRGELTDLVASGALRKL